MTTSLLATFAIVTSALLLVVLGWRDPKRLRALRLGTQTALAAQTRRWLGWSVLAPGLVLALSGEWHALLIWFGAVCTLGWSSAALLARTARAER